jgi:predicted DNA-binding protein with PD1-like motif
MKSRKVAGGYLVRLEKGEQAIEALIAFIAKKKIPCGVLLGIGAIQNVELGYFDLKLNQYRTKKVRKTVEVVSLMGNISYVDKKPFVHAHITVAGPDQKLLGGHFFKGTVAVTLEIYIRVINRRLNRFHDPTMGINFWDL